LKKALTEIIACVIGLSVVVCDITNAANLNQPRTTKMKDTKVTVAAVGSWISNTSKNIEKVEQVCKKAHKDGAGVAGISEIVSDVIYNGTMVLA